MTSVGAIILAGAQPWGGCVLERIVPRVLAPIANSPLIAHVLSWLNDSGIASASVCGNSYTTAVRQSLTNGLADRHVPTGLKLDYYEDWSPRGPAGCIRDAGFGNDCETLVVVEGCMIPQIDVGRLVQSHWQSGAALTVVVSNERKRNLARTEGLTPTGLYVFSREVLSQIPSTGYQDIKEALIPELYRQGLAVVTHWISNPAPRVWSVESYLAVNGWMLNVFATDAGGMNACGLRDYRKVGDSGIHATAEVDPSARLIGPVMVGEGSRIGRRVTLVGPTSIGPNCTIGDDAVIGRSSIWDECRIGRGTVLDRCIVTSRSTMSESKAYRYVVFSEPRKRSFAMSGWKRFGC